MFTGLLTATIITCSPLYDAPIKTYNNARELILLRPNTADAWCTPAGIDNPLWYPFGESERSRADSGDDGKDGEGEGGESY